MTLPSSPSAISLGQVNVELGLAATEASVVPISLNDTVVRNLFLKQTAGSAISLGDGHGKANISPAANLTLTNITYSSATISWETPANGTVTYYTVFVKDSLNVTVFTQTFNTIPLALTANINSGLSDSKTYTVYVRAGNASASGDASIVLTTLTYDIIPDSTFATAFSEVTNVEPASVNNATFTVTGLQVSFNRITVGVTGGTFAAATTPATPTSFTSTTGTYTTDSSGQLNVAIQLSASSAFNAVSQATLTVGTGTAIFKVTTRIADIIPDVFTFVSTTGANPGAVTSSSVSTIGGLERSYNNITVGVTGGSYAAGTTPALATTFTSTASAYTTNISNQLFVAARLTASASFNTPVTCTVTVGSGTATYTVTTRSPVLLATPFTFTPSSGVALSTDTTSAVVTVTGLEASYPFTVAVSGGVYAVANTAGGATTFVSTPTTLNSSASNTLFIAAKGTSSNSYYTAVPVTVQVTGTFSTTTSTQTGIYNITTIAKLAPDVITIPDNLLAAANTGVSSTIVTVTGLTGNYAYVVAATGGSISAAATTAGLGTFASTATTVTSGGTGSTSGYLYLQAKQTSSSLPLVTSVMTVSIGTGTATFTIKTAIDAVPDAFTFATVTGVAISSTGTSAVTTVSGMTANTPIVCSGTGIASWGVASTTNPTLSTYASAITVTTDATTGNLYVKLQLSSGPSYYADVSGTVTIGGVASVFTIQTVPKLAPTAFTIPSDLNVAMSSDITSSIVTVTGITGGVPIVVSGSGAGGSFSAASSAGGLGTFGSTAITVTSGGSGGTGGYVYFQARQTTGSVVLTTTVTTITVGSGTATYTVKTTSDPVPDSGFTFGTVTGAALSSNITNAAVVTISGMSAATPVVCSATGIVAWGVSSGTPSLSTYSSAITVNTDANGYLYARVQISTDATNFKTFNGTVTIGGVTGTYTVVSLPKTVPDAFTFTPVTGAATSTATDSSAVALTGLSATTVTCPVSVTGGSWAAGASAGAATSFATAAGSAVSASNGTLYIAARVTSSADTNQDTKCTVTVSGVTSIFTVTTVFDGVPDAFTVAVSTSATTNTFAKYSTFETLYKPGVTVLTSALGVTGLSKSPTSGRASTITVNASSGATAYVGTSTTNISTTGGNPIAGPTNTSGTIYVQLGLPAVDAFTATSGSLSIGGVSSNTVTVTTWPSPVPTWSFTDVADGAKNITSYTSVVTISGLSAGFNLWNGGYLIARTSGIGTIYAANTSAALDTVADSQYGTSFIVTPDAGGNIYIRAKCKPTAVGTLYNTVFRVGQSITAWSGHKEYAWGVTSIAATTATQTFTIYNNISVARQTVYPSPVSSAPIITVQLGTGTAYAGASCSAQFIGGTQISGYAGLWFGGSPTAVSGQGQWPSDSYGYTTAYNSTLNGWSTVYATADAAGKVYVRAWVGGPYVTGWVEEHVYNIVATSASTGNKVTATATFSVTAT